MSRVRQNAKSIENRYNSFKILTKLFETFCPLHETKGPAILKRSSSSIFYFVAIDDDEDPLLPIREKCKPKLYLHCKLKRAKTTPNSVSALLGPKLFWPYAKAILALESWIGTHGAIVGMEESQIGPIV